MRLIEIPHKVCDCTWTVNGLEDLYAAKTGFRVPDWFFFYMSGMAGFAYIKDRRATPPYMVNWGTRVKDQYSLLSEVVGFKWQVIENRSFPFTLQKALQAIDQAGRLSWVRWICIISPILRSSTITITSPIIMC